MNDCVPGVAAGEEHTDARPALSHLGCQLVTVRMIDLDAAPYGPHSLRRSKVALVYKKTGNLRACQLLLGHPKLESTVRYLGIEVDDALELSEQIAL
jgi:integrase